MLHRLFLLLLLLLPLFLLVDRVESAESMFTDEPLPDLVLPLPENEAARAYLGIAPDADSTGFAIDRVGADLLIIELFSMYCPYCQEAAPAVHDLFTRMEEASGPDRRLRILGLGANNTAFEVDFFRKSYDVPFPLFADQDMAMYNSLGGKGTPGFIACRRDPDSGRLVIFHRRSGGFTDAQAYLDELLQALEKK